MARPFLPLVSALIAGISCEYYFCIPVFSVQLSLFIAVTLVMLSLIWLKRKQIHFSFFILFSIFLLGILVMHLYLHPPIADNHILNLIGDNKLSVEGIICENPQVSPDKTELVVSVSRILLDGNYFPVSGRVLLNIRETYPFRYGDFVRFHARLRIPRNFNNSGGFDYDKYLRLRGILVRGFIKDASGFVVLRSDRGNFIRLWLENFRDLVRNAILEKASETEGAIIQAMILGDQKAIPKEVMEKFNRTGTSHIIAISGFNIGIIAVFILFLTRFCLKAEYMLLNWSVSKISVLFAILVVIVYTFIAGAGISVVRASIMVTTFMCAILFNREGDLYNTLCLAAFLILIITPYSLFDISFQLSFAAVASLIFFVPIWMAILPLPSSGAAAFLTRDWITGQAHKALRGIMIFFLASLSATLGTLPLILFYFNRLSLITLAANLVCVPILGVVAIPVCLAIILAVPLSNALANWVIGLSELLVQISLYFIDRFSALPWAAIYVTTPTLPEMFAFYILLIWIGLILKSLITSRTSKTTMKLPMMMKLLPIGLALFFTVDVLHLYVKGIHQGRLSLTAVDVGQGNSILIRLPGGKTMLVDGGGFFDDSFDLGKFVLAPYLWHERISRIDTVVLTHPHPDHLQGLIFILENFDVREVWTNGEISDTELFLSFIKIIREKGIAHRTLSSSTQVMNVSGVMIHFLNPEESAIRNAMHDSPVTGVPPPTPLSAVKSPPPLFDGTNDRSLAMKLSFGNIRFLLPADITQSVETRLVHAGIDLQSDAIFVPHHGSYRSSSARFLEQIKPQIAVVSCGSENVFGFPNPEVLKRYELVNAKVYRTDRDGAVNLTTDGQKLTVTTFMSGR